MKNQKLDMDKLDSEFEFVVERAETADGDDFADTARGVDVEYSNCGKNFGNPCNNQSNASCDGRGENVTSCSSEGVYFCHKVNNQGCHGAGRAAVKPKKL